MVEPGLPLAGGRDGLWGGLDDKEWQEGLSREESLGPSTRKMGSEWWVARNNTCTVQVFKPQGMASHAKCLLTFGQKQMLLW